MVVFQTYWSVTWRQNPTSVFIFFRAQWMKIEDGSECFFFIIIGKWKIWKGNTFSAIFVPRLHIEAREKKRIVWISSAVWRDSFKKTHMTIFVPAYERWHQSETICWCRRCETKKHWRLWMKSILKCFWKKFTTVK